MKFLLGLILGGAMVVVAAQRLAVDGPDSGVSSLGAWLTGMRAAAGQSEPGWAAREDQPTALPAQTDPAAGDAEVDAESLGAGPAEVAEGPLAADMQEPMVRLAGPEPLPPAEGPEPLPPAVRLLPAADPPAGSASETIQQVWAPFRSQTSAEGFARRLSSETEHPFGIDRRGPGRYQVFFAYADEEERRRLLEQVRPLIGTDAP